VGSTTVEAIALRERLYAAGITLTPIAALCVAISVFSQNGPTTTEICSFFAFYLFGEIGAEVGHHRYFSHRSFKASTPLKVFLAIAASISGKGSVFEFAAVHRRHHTYADHDGDPHSPHLHGKTFWGRTKGFFHSYYGWIFQIRMTPAEHARVLDLIRDPVLAKVANRRMYYVWMLVGVLAPGILALTWTQVPIDIGRAVLLSGFVRLFFQQHTAFLINSVCHLWGSRPFKTNDESANNFVLAMLTLGVGWHNNHHAFPYTAFNSFSWWQIDIAGWFIRACRLCGLATECQFPSKDQIQSRLKEMRL
jgi:stearoyl-CoA desaturase (delta-9 desaturase)